MAFTRADIYARFPSFDLTDYTALSATFTADAGTDTLTSTDHGLLNGDSLLVSNAGGGLPAGLNAITTYYVVNKTAHTFQLSLTIGGAPIDLTSNGTGTQTFARIASPNARMDVVVDLTIAGAEAQTDRTLFPSVEQADECLKYLTAHLLTLNPEAMAMRMQKSRGDDNLVTADDVFFKEYVRLARAASFGYRST